MSVYLENLVFDALDPRRLGAFWEAALGCERLTDEPGSFETRLVVKGGPVLDLCFQQVPEPPSEPVRLHLDLAAGARQTQEVERLVGLGAAHLDIGQEGVPWAVLADPEGNPFCVMPERAAYGESGPIGGLPLDSTDPERDVELWAWLTGWSIDAGLGGTNLRHPSGRGPILGICPFPVAKGPAKNRLHLDLRLERSDDEAAVVVGIAERGGRELDPGWGELPWRTFADVSGNEFCVLPARAQD